MAKPDSATLAPTAKPWFLYMIECAGGQIYTGIAVDVAARYAAHVAGKGARYTRANPPRHLLKTLAFADRAAASRAEYRVKQLTAAQKRAFVAGQLAISFDTPEPPRKSRRLKASSAPA